MRRLSAVLLLGGLLLSVVAAGRTWLVVATTDPVLGEISVDAAGADLSPAITGALVLAGAASLVALLTRGWSRRISAVVLCLAGVWACWLALSVLLAPEAAAVNAAQAGGNTPGALGSTAATVSGVQVSLWPWVFALAAALMALGAVGSLWATLRPERPAAEPGHPAAQDATGDSDLPATERRRRENAQAWDDLSDGKDLTP